MTADSVRGRGRPGGPLGRGVYVRASPSIPADDGFFGPGSVTWRVSADLSQPRGRAAGPASCRRCIRWPWPGWTSTATGARIRSAGWPPPRLPSHGHLRRPRARPSGWPPGCAGSTSTSAASTRSPAAYAAGDPALLLWVHATFVESGTVAVRSLLGTPLDPGGRVTASWPRWWSRRRSSGVPRDLVPASRAELDGYIASVRPELLLHAGRPGVDGLPARPAGPGRGHRRDLAGRAGCRRRRLPGLGARDVRVSHRRAAADRRAAGPRSARRSGCSMPCSSASRACSRPASGSPLRVRAARPA